MQKKSLLNLCLAVVVMGLGSCCKSYWSNENTEVPSRNVYVNGMYMTESEAVVLNSPDEAAMVFNKRVPPLNSLIVCRDKQCAPAELSKSREYIFNALAQLVDNNLDETALLCEGNAQTHVCVNPYLTVPAKIGVTPAYVYFDGVKIVDAAIENGKPALNLVLGYNLSYNGQTPTVCKPDKAMLYVKNNNRVVLNGNGFKCDMTSVGTTTIRVLFNVDYIDLDYGYIGGYYSIGLSGPAYGGGSGYGLIRLKKDAHPLSPALMAPEEEDVEEAPVPNPVVKPEINVQALKIDDVGAAKAVAPVEIKQAGENEPVKAIQQVAGVGAVEGGTSERQPLQADVIYSSSDDRIYLEEPEPVQLTPDAVVKSDKIVLNPVAAKSSGNAKNVGFGPAFEEVYVDDLDEYIK